jgi:hypothetical protein
MLNSLKNGMVLISYTLAALSGMFFVSGIAVLAGGTRR